MQQYGLTLNLRDDPAAIERYVDEHRHAWPEVLAQLREAGITGMKIYLLGRDRRAPCDSAPNRD